MCEEGSFTRAAQRENATQSGISQHVAAVERALKVKLFERTAGGVTPTPAGLRYYKRCVEAVGTLEHAAEEARSLAGEVTGELRIGLMPTFTRAVLAPVLDDFVPRCPEVRLHIVEGYSALLTEMVLDDVLDFAVVPAFEGTIGLKSRLLVRDREMLISGPRPALSRSHRCVSRIAGHLKSSCQVPTISVAAISRPIFSRTASRSPQCSRWTR